MSAELKFLKYLDDAVEYEKGKHKAIYKTCPPFSFDRIVEASTQYDEQSLNTMSDCIRKMVGHRVLKNVMQRRHYQMLVRENFEHCDFSKLSQIPQFNAIKRRILNNNPELINVDDGLFLRQIANAIAHGNYVKLLDIDAVEQLWSGSEKEPSIDSLKNAPATLYFQRVYGHKNSQYSQEVNDTIDRLNNKSVSVQITPFEMFQQTLESGMTPAEFVELKYESNYTIDQNGNRVKRPSTMIYNLKISIKDLDELSAFILPSMEQFTRVVPVDKPGVNIKPLNEKNTPLQDALKFLSCFNMAIYNDKDQSQEIIQLDAHQKKFFVNDYVQTRTLFPKSFFKDAGASNDHIADLLSTNVGTPYFGLSQLFTDFKMHKISSTTFALGNDIRSYFAFVDTTLDSPTKTSMLDLLNECQKKTYYLRQVFDVYSESLIAETLLLLQILEDGQQFPHLKNNRTINSVIKKFNAKTLKDLHASSKYDDDCLAVIHHLRKSFTHLTYLTNPNGDIYIYDRTSKKNKAQVFKFSIHIKSLEKIKNELLTTVRNMYSTLENIK